MGMYVNPVDMSKEDFLLKHGIPSNDLTNHKRVTDCGREEYLVCHVHNGDFTAAGICYSQRELEAFKTPRDIRPKVWFWVPKEELEQFGLT